MKPKIKDLPPVRQRQRAALLKGKSRARIAQRNLPANADFMTTEKARERLEDWSTWLFCFDYYYLTLQGK